MIMQDNEKKPALRFKGFTDPWEQRKLDEIANFSKGVGYSKNDLCEEGTPIILYGRLYTKYETSIFDVDTFVKEKAGSVYSKGGEVIVPASGETAEDISIASVVVKPGILLGGDLNIVSPTTEYDSAFLALTISSGAAHEYLSSLAQGKSVVHLHNADIQSVSAKFPTKREQEKIHLLFGKIDTLITLHQRKYERLVNIKKSMLDKMFPKNGASVPEIRFKGFTDPWEQRKLGELSRSFEYGLNAAAKEYDGQNKYLRITDIDDTSRQFVSADITSPDANLAEADNYRLSDGDVLFARTGASVGKTYLYKKSDGLVYFAGFLIRAKIKESVSAGFIFQNTLTRSYERYIAITSQRSGQPGVNAQEYAEYQLMLPELFEQEKIAKLLEALDTLITLHQRKLEKLQNIKKSCLEKMFV